MSLLRAVGRFWIVIVLISLCGVIAASNSEQVIVNIPAYGEFSYPLGFTFVMAFAFGASMVLFYFWIDVFQKTLKIRRLEKQLRKFSADSTSVTTAIESTNI